MAKQATNAQRRKAFADNAVIRYTSADFGFCEVAYDSRASAEKAYAYQAQRIADGVSMYTALEWAKP